jgi:hypothetical protein
MPPPAPEKESRDYGGNPEDLFSQAREMAEEALRARWLHEADWYIAREFYRGNQYAVWVKDRIVDALALEPQKSKKPRLIDNLCRPAIRTVLSYMMRHDPAFGVVASTGEPEDQAAALTSRAVLKHYWRTLQCEADLLEAGLWASICGAGAWKIGWDAQAGPVIPQIQRVPEMPFPTPELLAQVQAGGAMPEAEMVERVMGGYPAGDPRIDVLSPFEYAPEPEAVSLKDAQYVVHVARRPLDELRAAFRGKEKLIDADEPDADVGAYVKQVHQSFGADGSGWGKAKPNRVTVYELWHRRCKKWPQGLRLVYTKKGLLHFGPTPPGYDEIPLAELRLEPVPGRYWPDGLLRDAIPLQKEHNHQVTEWARQLRRSRPYWTAPEGSCSEDTFTDDDRVVKEFRPGLRPEYHQAPPIPEGVIAMATFSSDAVDRVTGATGVLQGRVKGETRSGRQVAYQGQYAESSLGLSAKAFARFLSRAGKLLLEQIQANVTEQRVAMVVGANRSQEVVYFKGADIRGQTDVVVEADTMLSFSKSERFNMLKEMHQTQVIDRDEFRQHMEIADFSPITEKLAQARNQAQRENEAWRRGEPTPMPRPFEDHQTHLAQHNYFRNSDAYRMLPPELMQAIDAHCDYHGQKVMMLAGLAPGPGGEPNPPSDGAPVDLGQEPKTPGDMQELVDRSIQQSGAELAEGLPPVPPVADLAQEGM